MHQNPYVAPLSNEAATSAPTKSRSAVFQWPFILAIIIWTVIAISLANEDRSWVALGISLLYGPAINAAIILLALFYGAARKFWNRRVLIGIPFLVTLIAALLSSAVIFGAIMSMDLHGC